MENFGLITYRTTAILFDEQQSDARYKNRVAYVVAHGKSVTAIVCCSKGYISFTDRLQSLPTNGSETWSRWTGGAGFGSTRALQHGWVGWQSIICTQVSYLYGCFAGLNVLTETE